MILQSFNNSWNEERDIVNVTEEVVVEAYAELEEEKSYSRKILILSSIINESNMKALRCGVRHEKVNKLAEDIVNDPRIAISILK
jgi:hypothetical protein